MREEATEDAHRIAAVDPGLGDQPDETPPRTPHLAVAEAAQTPIPALSNSYVRPAPGSGSTASAASGRVR